MFVGKQYFSTCWGSWCWNLCNLVLFVTRKFHSLHHWRCFASCFGHLDFCHRSYVSLQKFSGRFFTFFLSSIYLQSKPLKAALWIASKMRWWLRALLYVGLAIFFVAMCFGIGNLVSMFMRKTKLLTFSLNFLVGGGGVLYGLGSFQHKRNTGGALF